MKSDAKAVLRELRVDPEAMTTSLVDVLDRWWNGWKASNENLYIALGLSLGGREYDPHAADLFRERVYDRTETWWDEWRRSSTNVPQKSSGGSLIETYAATSAVTEIINAAIYEWKSAEIDAMKASVDALQTRRAELREQSERAARDDAARLAEDRAKRLARMSALQSETIAVESWVYFIQQGDDGPIKIGTTTDIEKRIAGLQTSNPFVLRLLGKIPGDERREHELHGLFAEFRLKGEWFTPSERLVGRIGAFIRGEPVCP